MKQRLGIAAALLSGPELLVLDEPVNGLDPAGIHEIRELLRVLKERGTTVFVSSHLLAEVEQVCDWIVVLRAGRGLFQGPTSQLLATRDAGLTVAVEDPGQLDVVERVCAAAGYATHRQDDGRLAVDAPASWAGALNRQAMAAGAALTELTPRQDRLESVFLEITAAAPAGTQEGEGP